MMQRFVFGITGGLLKKLHDACPRLTCVTPLPIDVFATRNKRRTRPSVRESPAPLFAISSRALGLAGLRALRILARVHRELLDLHHLIAGRQQ